MASPDKLLALADEVIDEVGRCPLLAQSGHLDTFNQCQLLGVKRTSDGHALMSAYDPKRTLNASFGFRRHSTDLRIVGSHSHLSRIDGENLQPGG